MHGPAASRPPPGEPTTPAIRAAERARVRHRVMAYERDPAVPAYGPEAAAALGLDPRRVFTTLVVAAAGLRGGRHQPARAAQALRTVVDASALEWPEVFGSAGRRGLEMALAPADLVRLTGAQVAPVSGE